MLDVLGEGLLRTAAIVAAGGALIAAGVKVWRVISRIVEWVQKVHEVVIEQLTPNGGDSESIADRIVRTEHKLDSFTGLTINDRAQILERVEKVEKKVRRHGNELARHLRDTHGERWPL